LTRKINIGFIGSGFVGQVAHLHNYNEIDNVNITALAELRQELGQNVANKYNINNLYKNHTELLENEKQLDAIILIVKRHQTAPLAEEVLKNKINLFTEKPMAPTFLQGQKNLNLAIKNKLHYVIGNMRRHDDGIQYVRKILNKYILNNELGSLISYRSYCYAGGDYCNIDGNIKTTEKDLNKNNLPIAPSWVEKKDEKNFEKFHNYFVHNINLINFFFEEDYKVLNKVSNKNGGSISFDHGLFFGQFDYAYLESDLWEEGIDFHFTHGSIKVTLPPAFLKNQPAKVVIYDGKKNEYYQPSFDWNWSFKNQSVNFINSIVSNEINICDARTSIKDLEVVENIWKLYS
jgi:predicted dehydrogenase